MTTQESHAHQETGLWETQGDRVIDGNEVVITLPSQVYIIGKINKNMEKNRICV